MKSAAAQLREWIDRRGYRQNEAAGMLGIHETFISHLLSGRRTPGLDRAVKIERLTGIPAGAWVSRRLGTKKSSRALKSVTV